MNRLIALAAASLAAVALSLTMTPSRSEAQAASCPIVDQCKTQCNITHTACRKDKFSPIFACEQNQQRCLQQCVLLGRNCGPRPTQQPGTRPGGKGGTTAPSRP